MEEITKSDNHNHIMIAPMDSMIKSARKKGVRFFSITEHISQFRYPRETLEFHSFHTKGRLFESLTEYKKEFSRIPKTDSLDLRMGLEVDYIPKCEDNIGNFVNNEKWDILLCSVHELSDLKDIERKGIANDKASSAKRWSEYMHTQLAALESDFIPFDVLTHPVRLYAGTPDIPSNMDDLLLELAKTASKRGKALELNGKDIQMDAKLVERLVRACGKAGCRVSLGSDAHSPEIVYRNLSKASKIARKLNVEVRV